jgi:hypothetical protein
MDVSRELTMSLFCRLSRRHYWCTPHRSADNHLVQVCYECGAERPVRELHNDYSNEKLDDTLSPYKKESKAYPRMIEQPPTTRIDHTVMPERIAVGQERRRLVIVK